MKDELDALRRAVDEATSEVIAAECALDEARGIERVATAGRQTAEGARNAAVAKLTEARAALDARLGIVPAAPRIVGHVLHAPGRLGDAFVTPAPPTPPVAEAYEDDDDPVR